MDATGQLSLRSAGGSRHPVNFHKTPNKNIFQLRVAKKTSLKQAYREEEIM